MTGLLIDWLNNNLLASNFQQELRGHLETCLMEGTTLVVTDVDVNDLQIDRRFHFILRSRYRFLTSTAPFKLMVSYKKAKERKATGSNRTVGAIGRDCCSVFSSSLSSSNSSSALSLLCCHFVILCVPSCDLVESGTEFSLSLFEMNKQTSFPECSFIRVERSLGIARLSLSVIVRVKVSHWPFYPEEDSMHHNTRWFLFQVGEHEIECQPAFRLVEALVLPSLGRMRFSVYLSAIRKFALLVCKSIIVVARLVMATTFPCQAVPASIAAYVNVVEFSQSRDGLEEMFLDRFLRLEKPRMQDTRTQVVDVSQGKNVFFFWVIRPRTNVQTRYV